MTRPLRLLAGGLLLFAALQPAFAQNARQGARAERWTGGVTGKIALDPVAATEWIPFVTGPGGLVTIRGTVDGQPVVAVVDTGAPYSAIDQGFARRHRIRLRQTVAPAKGRLQVLDGPVQSIRLGPLTQTGGRIAAIDLARIGRVLRLPMTMILGADYLRNMAVEFDFDRQRMRMRPSGATPPAGIAVPLGMIAANRFVTAMRIGDVALPQVLVDTGKEAPLAVSPRIWGLLDLTNRPVTSSLSNGLYGPVVSPLAGFDGVRIGPAPLPGRLEISASPGDILGSAADAMVGMDALRHFNLFLDARAGIMVLSPRAVPHVPRPPGTHGLLAFPVSEGLWVQHVMKRSPAERAGIRDGDVICTINGQSVARDRPGARTDWEALPPGTELTLGLCSGRTANLTLAAFY